MASVTQRISKITQPYGGYLPIKSFSKEVLNDSYLLNETENIHASLVGVAVDYLTRFLLGDSVDKVFQISCLGASKIGMLNKAIILKSNVTSLDDQSIVSACKLAGFDACFRSSLSAYKPIEDINPDEATIENIRIMVNRSVVFWNKYGPVVCSGFTFEGGYTDTVDSGDGDFLSNDTLWDFKVSKSAPTTKHSLQILMYYVMGLHSIHRHFKNLSNLGFFNPRLNIVYICSIKSISAETIAEIETDVLCYGVPGSLENENDLFQESKTFPDEYTIADICQLTGFKKSMVYADIRSGYLYAYKKGNKYFISEEDCHDYIERKKMQQIIKTGVTIALVIALVLLMLYIISRF